MLYSIHIQKTTGEVLQTYPATAQDIKETFPPEWFNDGYIRIVNIETGQIVEYKDIIAQTH